MEPSGTLVVIKLVRYPVLLAESNREAMARESTSDSRTVSLGKVEGSTQANPYFQRVNLFRAKGSHRIPRPRDSYYSMWIITTLNKHNDAKSSKCTKQVHPQHGTVVGYTSRLYTLYIQSRFNKKKEPKKESKYQDKQKEQHSI